MDELFERTLRSLGVSAFKAVVDCGIRSLDAFLAFDPEALPGVTKHMVTELISAQRGAEDLLATRSEQISKSHLADETEVAYSFESREPLLSVERVAGKIPDAFEEPQDFRTVFMNLSKRAHNALLSISARSIDEFLGLGREQLLALPNCGLETTNELMNAQARLKTLTIQFCGYENHSAQHDLRQYLLTPCEENVTQSFRLSKPRVRESGAGMLNDVGTIVEPRLDTPAQWSMLRKTVPELLQLDQTATDTLWELAGTKKVSDVLALPAQEWIRLARCALYGDDSCEVFLSPTIGYLLELHIGPVAFEGIVQAVESLAKVDVDSLRELDLVVSSDEAVVTCEEIVATRNFRIDSFDVPPHCLDALYSLGIQTWGELARISERIVLHSRGFSWDSLGMLEALWKMKQHAAEATMAVQGLSLESYSSFSSMTEAFVELVSKNQRDRDIMLHRLGLAGENKSTFAKLGEAFGLSAGRAQQIWRKKLEKLESPTKSGKLSRFWAAASEVLRLSGGACLLSELASGLADRLEWDEEPGILSMSILLRLRKNLVVDTYRSLVSDPASACLNCSVTSSALDSLFKSDNREQAVSAIGEHLLAECRNQHECKCHGWRFSEGYLRLIADIVGDVTVEDGVCYSESTWSARRGSRAQLVERTLMLAGRPMHFSEVCRELKDSLPDDEAINEHNVYSWIERSSNLLLWDRGTFVHRDFVTIPRELVHRVAAWLADKLNSGVPFVSIAGAYLAFEQSLAESGISCETALYTCLRQSDNRELAFPRYPYVVSEQAGYERLPVSIALEQYTLDAGGLVSYQHLRSYAVDDLCVAEQMFPIHLYNIPNVLRAGKGMYVHVQNLKLDQGKVGTVLAYTATVVAAEGHVSVEKVYADKRVSCLTMGIDCPEMLYAILQFQAGDMVQLPGYPQILAAGYQNANGGSRGVINEVVDYIAVRESPCSFDELEQHFVEDLGYNAHTVYNVLIRDNVVRYSRGSVIHLDTIGWTDEKQYQLGSQAGDILVKSREAGRCYAVISRILEYHRLPSLANDVVWTQTLLADLLVRGGRFGVLGSARNAFVATPNDEGIETFEDLVYELLKSGHEGACELESFEQDMRAAGVILKRVTSGMLGNQERVCISGHLIMLRELCGHA